MSSPPPASSPATETAVRSNDLSQLIDILKAVPTLDTIDDILIAYQSLVQSDTEDRAEQQSDSKETRPHCSTDDQEE